MYSIVRSADHHSRIPIPDVAIVKARRGLLLHQWDLHNRLSCFWLAYWNDTPGATLIFSDRREEMTPGKLVLIPPMTLVSAEVSTPFRHNFAEFACGGNVHRFLHAPRLFDAEALGVSDPEAAADPESVPLYFYSLICRMLLALPKIPDAQAPPLRADGRILQALDLIATLPPRQCTNAFLSKKVNLSETRFLHLFKSETGYSPRHYLRERQMELAWKLLSGAEGSLPEIAELCGFTDRSHFSREFRRLAGETPAAARKRLQRDRSR